MKDMNSYVLSNSLIYLYVVSLTWLNYK